MYHIIGYVVVIAIMVIAITLLSKVRDRREREAWEAKLELKRNDPHWEVVAATDASGVIFGYKVRWSEASPDGKYLWVGHYHAGDDGDPSIGWCHVAADSDAKRKNEEGKCPWEYPAYHK